MRQGEDETLKKAAGCGHVGRVGRLGGIRSRVCYPFERPLRKGDEGKEVKALQVRVAGWYPGTAHFDLDGSFGRATSRALKAFQSHYGLKASGVARPSTFKSMNRLQDDDRSTAHFDYSEFDQNFNPYCSAQANAYASTFAGGVVRVRRTKRNVRRLMWRLEAVRAKGGNHAIGINSGFRSLSYNRCIGGASASQHLYGTAADQRMAHVDNRRQRNIAKGSQVSGIGCYSSQSHNHLDIRLDNVDLPASHYWWPDRDRFGRDLDETGRPCWGEEIRTTTALAGTTTALAGTTSAAVVAGVAANEPGAGSLVPSDGESVAFERAGEVEDLNGAD